MFPSFRVASKKLDISMKEAEQWL